MEIKIEFFELIYKLNLGVIYLLTLQNNSYNEIDKTINNAYIHKIIKIIRWRKIVRERMIGGCHARPPRPHGPEQALGSDEPDARGGCNKMKNTTIQGGNRVKLLH